jgi:hypothetical protein
MLAPWIPPAIIEHGCPSYQRMVARQPDYLTAIVWTETTPAHALDIPQPGLTDICAIKTWLERETEMAGISVLPDNWDGFGSPAPDPATMERAASFFQTLREREPGRPPMRIAVSPDGFIGLEWLDGASFRRAEIGDTDEVEWMLAIPGQETRFWSEHLAPSGSEVVHSHEWQPAPSAADVPDYAFGR